MKHTIRYGLFILIITGAIFTTGCFSQQDVADKLDKALTDEVSEESTEAVTEEKAEEGSEVKDAAKEEEKSEAVQEVKEEASVITEVSSDEIQNTEPAPVAEPVATQPEPTVTPEPTVAPEPTPEPAPAETAPVVEESVYKDGTFDADASYVSPAGEDPMSVSLDIKNDVVTGVKIGVLATNETSKMIQNNFSSGIGSVVVGKKLSEIEGLAIVSGASLSTKAFNKAVKQIEADAKA